MKNNIFKTYIAKAKIPYIFPANRLPRNKIDIDNMADSNPDKKGFLDAIDAELSQMSKWKLVIPTKIYQLIRQKS